MELFTFLQLHHCILTCADQRSRHCLRATGGDVIISFIIDKTQEIALSTQFGRKIYLFCG